MQTTGDGLLQAIKHIKEVHRLLGQGSEDAAADYLFDVFDRAIEAGQWVMCDEILLAVSRDMLTDNLLYAILVMTYAGKDMLKARGQFYEVVLRKFSSSRGEQKANSLLARLV